MINSQKTMEIDLSALEHNLNQAKKIVTPETRIMAVVKSDAYGHGMVEISQKLEKLGVYSLGVAYTCEALELREKGIKLPITVLCGITSPQDAHVIVEKDLTPVVFNAESLELLADTAFKRGRIVNFQLKVDTGMGRLGVHYRHLRNILKKITEFKTLRLEGLMSHLSSADEQEKDFTKEQIGLFKNSIETAHSMGMDIKLNNIANSAGLMAHKYSHFDMVRPGIMLYGGLPSPDFRPPVILKPVMDLRARILQIRQLPIQTPVSYGRTYYTRGEEKIAVISIGYGDGLHRKMANTGKVIINGKKVDIVGTVCMNMIACNITGLPNVRPGDEAIILGSQGDETITGDDIARWVNTISYEIFCSLGQKNIRKYKQ